jgi:hypothetical protein
VENALLWQSYVLVHIYTIIIHIISISKDTIRVSHVMIVDPSFIKGEGQSVVYIIVHDFSLAYFIISSKGSILHCWKRGLLWSL